MKKIALTSLLAMVAATAANANVINGNPLYKPAAGHFASVTTLKTHSNVAVADDSMMFANTSMKDWTLGEAFSYGITDDLTIGLDTSVSRLVKDDFNAWSWNNFGLDVDYRVFNIDGWVLDGVAGYSVSPVGARIQDADDEVYASSAAELVTEILQYVETDDELAGVIGHELSHISLNHIIKGAYKNAVVSSLLYGLTTSTNKTVATSATAAKSLTSLKLSRNDEYEADMTGADLMVNAGYNPLGEISVLNKICEKSVDFLSDHPSGDKRVVALYDYITYNYPQFYNTSYPTSSYASFRSYMGPKVMERKASEKLTKKYEKEQAKLKKKHVKNLEKMKKGTFGWDASYAILNSLSTQQSSDTSNAQ